MTFKEMQDEVISQLKDDSTAGLTNVKRWLNMAGQVVVYDMDWPMLRRQGSLSILANTRAYVLPADVHRVLSIYIPSEDTYLREVNPFRFDQFNPQASVDTSRHQPSLWFENRWVGALAQPSSASAIRVAWAAAEGTARIVTIVGTVGGVPDRDTVTVTGAAGNASTTKSFTQVDSITKAGATASILTVTSNAAAVTQASISPLMLSPRFIEIVVDPVPGAAYTATYKYLPWLPDLVNDSDSSLIPERHHELIIARALMYGYKRQSSDAYNLAAREYQALKNEAQQALSEDGGTVNAWSFGSLFMGRNTKIPTYEDELRKMYWGS